MQEEEKQNEVRGLKIKTLNYIFVIVLLVFTAVLLISTLSLSSGYTNLIQTTDEYHRIERNARNVMSASDDLTKDAQLFVMTGNRSYLDSYFKEADVTKRRENAIQDLEDLKVTGSLMELLENSVEQSMELMQLEYEAMRYAAEGYHIDISTLPDQVRYYELPASAAEMTDAEKIEKAQEIAFGEEYAAYKSRIRGYEQQYIDKAILLMDEIQEQNRGQMEANIIMQRVGVALIFLVGLILFYAIARMLVRPLNLAVKSIYNGDTISPVHGAYEIRYMSQTYNNFRQTNMEIQKRLNQQAERDELTGVLNRRGYQMVINRLELEAYPLALIVMDIDSFKDVNDTYGHTIGDVALQKVGNLLRHTFRESDIISRIGGDEFTVIMSGITEINKDIIQKKIDSLNETLMASWSEECPPLSLSCGCAFSHSGYNSRLFDAADAKLYEAKNEGGCAVFFAE